MPDLTKLFTVLPALLKWGTIIGSLSLILFYGSLARHGLPKISWSYRMVARICLGSTILFLSFRLGQFVPNFWDLPSILLVPLKSLIAGVILAISTAISFYFFFYQQRQGLKSEEGTKLQQFMHDNKKIIGTILLILILTVIVFGFAIPRPEEEKFELPVIGELFKPEDPACLHARTVFQLVPIDAIFGENATLFESPEKLEFLLEDYPGYKIKGGVIAETEQGVYILTVLTQEGYSDEEMQGPDELFNMKYCTVRPSDLKKCDCTSFLGIADVFLSKMKDQIEGMQDIMPEGLEGMVESAAELKPE